MREPFYRPYASSEYDDLAVLLPLSNLGERSYRSSVLHPDPNERFGAGQLAGQALWAAAQSSQGWSACALQLTILSAPQVDGWLEYSVESSGGAPHTLTRHVYGVQGRDTVSSIQVRFAEPGSFATPHRLTNLSGDLDAELPGESVDQDEAPGGARSIPLFEVRLPAQPPSKAAENGDARRHVWCRLKHALPLEGVWCAAALAYMAASSVPVSPGMPGLAHDEQGWKFGTRDFSMLFHSGAFDVNAWLLFDSEILQRTERLFSFETRIYSRSGVHLATSMQTCAGRDEC